VATAMSQIMRYWSYPAKGTGSSSYNSGATYGVLSANYNHPYRWANMPLTSPNSSDTDLARLMSDAGISVQMNYSPSGSGAYVITADDPSACAQISYVNYFNYSPAIIDGEAAFTDATAWQDTLENELNHSRPIQYVGADPSAGGHTWVCDGYDASNNFHMNWGWSGADDGWFALNNLSPGGSYHFSQNIEALMGIMPPGLLVAFSATPSVGCVGMKVTFTDQTTGQGTPTAWKWMFGDGGTATTQNPTHTYSTSGTFNVTEIVTDNTGKKDTLVKKACITVEPSTANALPLTNNFQSTFPSTGWVINNPNGHKTVWAQATTCGGYGKSTQSMFYDNCNGGALHQYDQIYTPKYNFTAVTKPVLYFDVAYAPWDTIYTDTLAIYYSTDCGSNWNKAYLKGGVQLSTVGGTGDYTGTGCFVPTSTQWRTDTIKIPSIAGMSAVLFSFENRSGNGNDMYIDNINIPGVPTSIPTITNTSKVSVYPNPNNGSFTVELNNVQDKQQLEIYNMLGQNVYGTVVMEGKTQVNFTQTPGVYFYRIFSLEGNLVSEGKIIVK
jgi:PKD repeat protein